MGDFIYDNLRWACVAGILLLIGYFIMIGKEQEKDRLVFMEQCLEDHKKYECKVLWSQTGVCQ